MITAHVWRPVIRHGFAAPECGFMNCRRPRSEHERGVNARSDLRGER